MIEEPRFTFKGTSLKVFRMGYGAMQLAGPHVFGPPKDPEMAVRVLRRAIELGINHIDTSDFYGPHATNQVIKRALHPYPKDLVIVTKVGAKRGPDASWNLAMGKEELINAVHDNLKNLGLEALDVVNLRVGPPVMPEDADITEPFSVLVELKRQGKIKHLGLSTVTPKQLADCQKLSEVVCIQNLYNVIHRKDDAFIDDLDRQGIAYVPYFPLGGFTPIQSNMLNQMAERLHGTPMQAALAWLYRRRKNILLIPGTSSLKHLEENFKAKDLDVSSEIMQELDQLANGQV